MTSSGCAQGNSDDQPPLSGYEETPARRARGRTPLLPPAPPTTDLTDREEFRQILDDILSTAERLHRSISLVMIQITRTGRATFTVRLATALSNVIRKTDGVWRLGPRTLLLALADVDGAAAAATVGRLRVWMANQAMVPLTLAWSTASPGIDAATLLELLDVEIAAATGDTPDDESL